MTKKILGLDLGTGSIGLALRNPDLGANLTDQIEYMSVDVFQSGVGMDKTGEYSFAAERRKHRLTRRLHTVRKRRLWATLKLLIAHDICPMSPESLKQWSTYDKAKGLYRTYPIEDKAFDSWIKLDFDGDGKPDYSSPYQLRKELVNEQLDFNLEINRYKLGRALYHIAQRRAFKSSKGQTIADSDKEEKIDLTVPQGEVDELQAMKESETKLSSGLKKLMDAHGLKTVGQAMAMLEDQGKRIRNNAEFKPVRDMLKKEILEIFRFQEGLHGENELLKHLISEKKGEGTIFYKNPLRSQRGLVGKCTLEPNKPRCPISHPTYEKFRALSFLNNIKFREDASSEWQTLPLALRDDLYKELFESRVKADFPFKEIRTKIEKRLGVNLGNADGVKRINYRDDQSVSGCPVTARLVKLLGEDWEQWTQQGNKQRNSRSGKEHQVSYNAIDIWEFCYNADEPEQMKAFADERMHFNDEQYKNLTKLWNAIRQGYAMLSLKAIKKINAFLELGLIYPDAVLLAKVPELTGETDLQKIADTYFSQIKGQASKERMEIQIANNLIARYKSLTYEEQWAFKNTSYELDDSDEADILREAKSYFGSKRWAEMPGDECSEILQAVEVMYQGFFRDEKRNYIEVPKLDDTVKDWLKSHYPTLTNKELGKLYHHSMISIYPVKKSGTDNSEIRLGNPNVGGIKNPVALRTLHVLKRKINAMLDAHIIDPKETRLVVETARDFNDANMRKAIETFNRSREAQNLAIKKLLNEVFPKREINATDVDKARYVIEQKGEALHKSKKDGKWQANWNIEVDAKKYKLWLEQGCKCLYTGKVISLSNLFDDNSCDLEHTIPRSISFDNSDANLTVCDAHYNRYIKGNKLPTQLPNYDKAVTIDSVTYSAIKPRLKQWEDKKEHLQQMVQFWKRQSKFAADKDRKDQCVQQRHLWQMELNYWSEKLGHFTANEVSDGFRHSQMVDTGIITKYAALYLKSVFKHVDVQKGSVTAVYRKMLGVQSIDEKKSRDQHSHHAIDATMLTLIPYPARRERMIKLFYEIEEAKKLHHDCQSKEVELQTLKDSCQLGHNVAAIVPFINSRILINRRSNDRALAEAKKRMRVRGRVKHVVVDGEEREMWSQGDSIRGRLHKETYFGAIRLPKETADGKPANENSRMVYSDKTIYMVVRTDIKSFSKEEDLMAIIDRPLRERLINVINQRIWDGMTFKEAIAQDIWPLDKNGKERKTDKNGRPLSPIRHVRCKVKAGRGYMTYEKSIEVHKHAYESQKQLINLDNRDYKHYYYAQNDTNYAFLLYEGMKKGKVDRKSQIVSLYDLSKLADGIKKCGSDETYFRSAPAFCKIKDKGITYLLKSIFRVGTKVLLYDKDPTEIVDIINDSAELSKKLFVVVKFNNKKSDFLYLSNHINAKSKDDGIDFELVPNKINCLVEGEDFVMDDLGQIKLIER